jgi:hypothetical protein
MKTKEIPDKYTKIFVTAISMLQKQLEETGGMNLLCLFGSIENTNCVWPDYDLSDRLKRKFFSEELRKIVRREGQAEFFLMVSMAKINDDGDIYRGLVFQLETKEGYFLGIQKSSSSDLIEAKLALPGQFKFSKDSEGFFSNMLDGEKTG